MDIICTLDTSGSLCVSLWIHNVCSVYTKIVRRFAHRDHVWFVLFERDVSG